MQFSFIQSQVDDKRRQSFGRWMNSSIIHDNICSLVHMQFHPKSYHSDTKYHIFQFTWHIRTLPHWIPSTLGRICPYSHQNMVGQQPTWKLTLSTHTRHNIKNRCNHPTTTYYTYQSHQLLKSVKSPLNPRIQADNLKTNQPFNLSHGHNVRGDSLDIISPEPSATGYVLASFGFLLCIAGIFFKYSKMGSVWLNED